MPYPHLMGILNITPDSFSDGGRMDKASILAHLDQLLSDGADIIDVGAESTRPGATPLTAKEEWQRLEPLLTEIIAQAHQQDKQVSLDTRHPETALKALDLGVDIINDVSGCTNPAMINILAAGDCDIVFMHSLTIPVDKSVVMDEEKDIVQALIDFSQERINALTTQGIDKHRLIFDPGIGFNKTAAQSWEILRRVDAFQTLGTRLLIGHSRKSFLNDVTNAPFADRDPHTLAISAYLLQENISILRIHDVRLHRELMDITKRLTAT